LIGVSGGKDKTNRIIGKNRLNGERSRGLEVTTREDGCAGLRFLEGDEALGSKGGGETSNYERRWKPNDYK
jgi:hypothetical protein